MPQKKKTTNKKGAGQKAIVSRTKKRVKAPQKKIQVDDEKIKDDENTVSLEHDITPGRGGPS